MTKLKQNKTLIGSIRCKACNAELPYIWEEQYCEDCMKEFDRLYQEELQEYINKTGKEL